MLEQRNQIFGIRRRPEPLSETALAALKEVRSPRVDIAQAARKASRILASTSSEQKNNALRRAAELIRENQGQLIDVNTVDVEKAKQAGVKGSFLDRLELNPSRIEGMAAGLEKVAELPDPVGRVLAAAEAGATAIIQPGGSMRDDEVIAAADEAGLAMVFTGMRHFRH